MIQGSVGLGIGPESVALGHKTIPKMYLNEFEMDLAYSFVHIYQTLSLLTETSADCKFEQISLCGYRNLTSRDTKTWIRYSGRMRQGHLRVDASTRTPEGEQPPTPSPHPTLELKFKLMLIDLTLHVNWAQNFRSV